MHKYLVLFAALAACGDNDAGEGDAIDTIDPSSVRADDLYGYWLTDPWTPEETTFAFLPPARAAVELAGEGELPPLPDADVSVVWVGGGTILAQLAEFSLRAGGIYNKVLADIASLPGTEYLTEILELVPGERLVLESKQTASGSRTYQYFDRCPIVNEAGWHVFRGTDCLEFVNQGASLAFDRHGTLHAIRGGGSRSATDQCAGTPTFVEVTRGCTSRVGAAPSLRNASLAVGADDVVRVAYVSQPDNALVYADRAIGDPVFSKHLVVVDDFRFADAQDLVMRGDEPVIAYSADAGVVLATLNGTAFDTLVTRTTDGQPLAGRVRKAVAGPDDRLHLLLYDAGRGDLWSETTTGVFEKVPLPSGPTLPQVMDVYVAPSGKLHAIFNTGGYGILEGGSWSVTSFAPFQPIAIATHGEGPPRVLAPLQKAAEPEVALLTIGADGALDFELTSADGALGPGNSPQQWERNAFAVGPGGEVAYTFNGASIDLRGADGPVLRKPVKLALTINAEADVPVRVVSRDGLFDCTDDCERVVLGGARIVFDIETDERTNVFAMPCDFAEKVGRTLRCEVLVHAQDFFLTVVPRRSAAAETLRIGDGGTANSATTLGVSGRYIALAGSTQDGRFVLGDIALEREGLGATLAVVLADTQTRTGWIAPVPLAASVVEPRDDGGAQALFVLDQQQTIGEHALGTPGTATLARVTFDASGAITAAEPLVSGHRTLRVLAADLAGDGSGHVIISVAQPLALPSGSELPGGTSVLRVAADGGVDGALLVASTRDGAWHIAAEGARAVIANDRNAPATLYVVDGAEITQTRSFDGAIAQGVALSGDRVAALLDPNGGTFTIDLGDGPVAVGFLVATFDTALNPVAHREVELPIATSLIYGITFVDGDVISFIGGKVLRHAADLSIAAQTAITYAHQLRDLAIAPHGGGLAFLVEQTTGLVDYDGIEISGQGARVVLDFAAP